ncbi:MAG TPA: FAD-dependent monooxygenase [Coleofasciculaceae cyanobacterium]|jgi:2-polyprenyl-6-methoxyphenol hydroxylase-like FAD-dependent oxidoreductase
MAQVVIVGAGPTGAVTALLLVQRGIKVKLIEASRDFKRLFRGEGLMPSGLDALEQMGLLELLTDIPHQTIDAWEFLLSNQSLFRVDEPIETNGRHCTTVSQPDLLEAIIKQAEAYSQFEFIQGESVQDLVRKSGRVCGVKLSSGVEISAALVIAGDGRNSVIRKKAGINLTKLQNNVDILWFQLDSGARSPSQNIFYSILQGREGFGLFRGSSGKLHIGWGLHADDNYAVQELDWAAKLAATSPPGLAEHILNHQDSLTKPMHLSVVVGRCERWSIPGLLLLGDAVHPMSPIRAQGINMAFRDAIVAVNHLVPLLSQTEFNLSQIDAALPIIQQEREPEIVRIQKLQAQEMGQAELLHNSAFVRWGAKTFTPIIRPGIRASWLRRQKQLRQGVTDVHLIV